MLNWSSDKQKILETLKWEEEVCFIIDKNTSFKVDVGELVIDYHTYKFYYFSGNKYSWEIQRYNEENIRIYLYKCDETDI